MATRHSDRPPSAESIPAARRAPLTALAVLLCGSLYLLHFYYIAIYAVDVPYRDEWEAFAPGALPAGFSFKWIFAFANEHRIVTTKLLIWLLFTLTGWNLIAHIIINFLLYGLLLLLIVKFARKTTPALPLWAIVAFLPFLLSPINNENHFMGYQSSVHFVLIFFLAAIYFLFDDTLQPWRLAIGCAMALLAIFSMSSGVVMCLIALAGFVISRLQRAWHAPDAVERSREARYIAISSVVIVGALALWFTGYHSPAGSHPALPVTVIFWRYFLNLLAAGLGYETLSVIPGLLFLGFVLWPVVGTIWQSRGAMKGATWAIHVAILGVLGALAATSVGRAIDFGIEQSKSSRYTETTMLLIPLAVLAWSNFLEDRPRLRARVIAGFWIVCGVTFLPTWSLFSVYRDQYVIRTAGVECVEKYYRHTGLGHCKALYPFPLGSRLDAAKKMNASFYRRIAGQSIEHIQ